VCEQLVSVIGPAPPAPVPADLVPVVKSMFACINSRLAAQDQDQEVKECAILGMAHLVATCGDTLTQEVRQEKHRPLSWTCTMRASTLSSM